MLNKHIKYVPYRSPIGRRTLVPRAVYMGSAHNRHEMFLHYQEENGMIRIWRSETDYLITRLVGVFFLFVILSCVLTVDLYAREKAPKIAFNVGYQVLDFKYTTDDKEQSLAVAVWYPTVAKPKAHNYGGPTHGNVAEDAAFNVKGGAYPLLVFSHGYGGGGLGSVFFTEALAAHGWIVACPDHHDRHLAVRIRTGQKRKFDRWGLRQHAKKIGSSSPRDRGKYLYRLDEMKITLDRLLNHPSFGKFIDKEQIAVGGHSFGGFTALGLCGTIKERHDARIKAVLLFSTGAGGYLFTEDELRGVGIPSMLFMGERERDQLRGSKTMTAIAAKIHKNLSPPKYFLEIRDANHFSFNNRFVENRRTRLLSGTEEQFEVIRQYSIAFLETHVANRSDSNHVLKQIDSMLTRYRKELRPDRSKQGTGIPTTESAEQGAPRAEINPRP